MAKLVWTFDDCCLFLFIVVRIMFREYLVVEYMYSGNGNIMQTTYLNPAYHLRTPTADWMVSEESSTTVG